MVETRYAVEQLGDVVMRLDLGGVRVPVMPSEVERLAELVPVHFRVSDDGRSLPTAPLILPMISTRSSWRYWRSMR